MPKNQSNFFQPTTHNQTGCPDNKLMTFSIKDLKVNFLTCWRLLPTFMSLMHQEILQSVQGGNRPGERHGAW
jgi:hypothetical protein